MDLSPSLLAQLRAFEAVGRHMSFTRAAEELWVTPAALSHHVRHLERQLGTALLVRKHRRIELTPTGRELLTGCAQGLQVLKRAVLDAAALEKERPLTVSVAPYFSAIWLTPRLSTFWAAHPDVDLQLHHAYQPMDFFGDQVDAGINWGSGDWPGAATVRLLSGDLTAVCSADLFARLPTPLSPQALLGERLFYEFNVEHWNRWFVEAGVTPTGPIDAVRIDDSHALRRVALDGQGIALFFSGLIHEDIRRGHLIRPFDVHADPGAGYYLARPVGRVVNEKLSAFWNWVLDEANRNPYA
ncbi:LysR substrate-binding domain-containing protein [Pseudonocardia sp. NPDC049635]|uniref:LysR substrate-binding domain-containing protein n=1 Tax=Pseudonocardia sp. NPDC049635 TaxID=3155506 RepID=UPI0033D4E44A